MALKEQQLDSYVENIVLILDDEIEKTQWKKNKKWNHDDPSRLSKGSYSSCQSKLDTTHVMFTFLESMHEINNTKQAIALKQQLHHVKMNKSESITSYFIRITKLRNQISSIGHIIDKKKSIMLACNEFTTSREAFKLEISAQSKLPKFD